MGDCLKEDPTLPFQEIRKRDGRIVPFDAPKITEAIFKAARAVGGEDYSLAEKLTGEVIQFLSRKRPKVIMPSVEEIQDVVEKVLIEEGHARTAKAYILYRAKRTRIREARSELMDVVKDILLEGQRSDVEELCCSPAEKLHRIALAASQKYYLDNLLPADIAAAHQAGSCHVHSLGYYSKSLDSLHLDLFPLLQEGFFLDGAYQPPPGDIVSAFLGVALVIQKCQGDLYGEQSLPHFDSVVSSLLRRLGEKDYPGGLESCLRSFFSYLSALPFSMEGGAPKCSIEVGLDTTDQGRELTAIILEEIADESSRTGHWPQVIFTVGKGVNLHPDDANFDLYSKAVDTALKKGRPSFSFAHSNGACYFSSGLRVAENRHGKAGGKKRGNVASISINLPRLALLTMKEDLFFVELDRLLQMALRQLLHRFEVLAVLKCRDLPFLMSGLYMGSERLSPDDSIKESVQNGMVTINFAGLPEAVLVLTGGSPGKSEYSYRLALDIVERMSRRVKSFAGEYDLNMGLSCIEDEELLRLFAEKDRQDFGVFKGVTDRRSYSSSFVLSEDGRCFEQGLALEGKMHRFCTAGHSTRLLFPAGMHPQRALEAMSGLFDAGIGYARIGSFNEEKVK